MIFLRDHSFSSSKIEIQNRNSALPCPVDETLCFTMLSNKFYKWEGKKQTGSTGPTVSPNSPRNWVFNDKVIF